MDLERTPFIALYRGARTMRICGPIVLLLAACFVLTLFPEPAGAGKAELKGLKIGALRKKAVEVGCTPEEVEDAMDEDNAKSALISLIIEVEEDNAKETDVEDSKLPAAAAAPKKKAISRTVLETMQLPNLVKLMRKLEVTEEEIDELLAISDVVKDAVIDKIVEKQGGEKKTGKNDSNQKAQTKKNKKKKDATAELTEEEAAATAAMKSAAEAKADIRAKELLKKATCAPEECSRLAPLLREALAVLNDPGAKASGVAPDATDGQVLLEIENGASMDDHGWNAMHRATQEGRLDHVEALIELGIPLGAGGRAGDFRAIVLC